MQLGGRGNRILFFLWFFLGWMIWGCLGCHSKPQGELEDFYFFRQFRLNDYHTIVKTVVQQDLSRIPPNQLLPALISTYRQSRMLSIYRQLSDTLASQLIQAYQEYRKLMEGNFYLFYKSLLYLRLGRRAEAVTTLGQFLEQKGIPEQLKSLAQDAQTLLQEPDNLSHFCTRYISKAETRAIGLALILSDSVLFAQARESGFFLLNDVPFIQTQIALKNGALSPMWQAFSRSAFEKPIFRERVTKQDNEGNSLYKRFYNPAMYSVLEQIYRFTYHTLAREWVNRDLVKMAGGMDSVKATRFFYFNLELARSYQLGLDDISEVLFQKLPEMVRTPFQNLLLQVYREAFLFHKGEKSLHSHTLPSQYHPFMQALLDASRAKEMSAVGVFITEEELEGIRRRLDKFAVNTQVQEFALGFTGLVDLNLRRWKGAMIYLNYPLNKGFDLSENDPLDLVYLMWAIWNEKSQMSECNWILSELRKEFPYTEALYRWANEVIAARHFK